MKIGFTLPQTGILAGEAGEVGRFAREVERLGADSVWVSDRLLAPVEPSVGYGGGDTVPESFKRVLDPFAIMSVAAAVTERVEIGANVLNAPWYAPAVLARSLTTIDQVSGGRLLPGFGTGWSPEEYQAAGIPMTQRGARLDECLDVLDAWWSENPVKYDGKHTTVPASYVNIKPARSKPPVYLAGFAPAAMQRVARRAAGWLPVHAPEAAFDPASINEPMNTIRGFARDAGRDPDSLGAVLRIYPATPDSREGILDTIARSEKDTPVDHVLLELVNVARTVDQALEVAEQVLRAVRS